VSGIIDTEIKYFGQQFSASKCYRCLEHLE